MDQNQKPTGAVITAYTLEEVCLWIKEKYGHDYYTESGVDGKISGYIIYLLRMMFTRNCQGLIEFKQEDIDTCFASIVKELDEGRRKDLTLFSQFVEDLLDEFGGAQRRVYLWNY